MVEMSTPDRIGRVEREDIPLETMERMRLSSVFWIVAFMNHSPLSFYPL
jgi:hypothetical protein